MKKFWKYIIITSLVSILMLPSAVLAAKVNLSQYQDLMIRYSILLGDEEATSALEALTYEQWQYLYNLTPSTDNLARAVTDLERLTQDAADQSGIKTNSLITPQFIAPNVTVEGEFEPDYPDVDLSSESCIMNPTSCYGYYIFFASLMGFFAPDTGEAGIQDDRCNEHSDAVQRANHLDLHNLAIDAQAACDLASLGVELIACPAAAAAWMLDHASEELIQVCEVHTGNVDSAEIEAAYENTRTILNGVNNVNAILGDETNFTDDTELATHDSDIKEQLELIKSKLDHQQAQLDEIIRLLKTPQGKRPDWNK